MPIELNWISTSTHNEYLQFYGVDLNDLFFEHLRGVYIIWYKKGKRAVTVYAGKAKLTLIKERLKEHRDDPEIMTYAPRHLYVAVAPALIHYIDGIERFLHDTLQPLVGEQSTHSVPLPVSLPDVGLRWY
ncbi:hypothetical protein C6499_22465 [Candidatus Poribacteria bacterium]|nr:MAG: hypothetical protein C6499_22465 [Candidatus Poribacteria bacterium]